jgi:hypothetical protein
VLANTFFATWISAIWSFEIFAIGFYSITPCCRLLSSEMLDLVLRGSKLEIVDDKTNEILVPLSYTDRQMLLHVLPKDSEIWTATHNATRLLAARITGPHYVAICDQAGAEVLLHFARQHCRDLVPDLERAIRQNRLN